LHPVETILKIKITKGKETGPRGGEGGLTVKVFNDDISVNNFDLEESGVMYVPPSVRSPFPGRAFPPVHAAVQSTSAQYACTQHRSLSLKGQQAEIIL
jgi:hypothetical protein